MKASELASMSVEELKNRLADAETALARLRFQKALQQLERPTLIRQYKREIAQIKTRLREIELGIWKAKEEKP